MAKKKRSSIRKVPVDKAVRKMVGARDLSAARKKALADLAARPANLESGVAMTDPAANHEEPLFELRDRVLRRLLRAMGDSVYNEARLTAQTAALLAVRG